MWKQRLHKLFHRIVGGSVAVVGLLTELKTLDLSVFLGDHAAAFVTAVGLAIVALEFLPVIGQMLDGDQH